MYLKSSVLYYQIFSLSLIILSDNTYHISINSNIKVSITSNCIWFFTNSDRVKKSCLRSSILDFALNFQPLKVTISEKKLRLWGNRMGTKNIFTAFTKQCIEIGRTSRKKANCFSVKN